MDDRDAGRPAPNGAPRRTTVLDLTRPAALEPRAQMMTLRFCSQ
jgi:hypothetical protein